MKVEIETQIEVTMKMNLREARIIEEALLMTPDTEENNQLYRAVTRGLEKAVKGEE